MFTVAERGRERSVHRRLRKHANGQKTLFHTTHISRQAICWSWPLTNDVTKWAKVHFSFNILIAWFILLLFFVFAVHFCTVCHVCVVGWVNLASPIACFFLSCSALSYLGHRGHVTHRAHRNEIHASNVVVIEQLRVRDRKKNRKRRQGEIVRPWNISISMLERSTGLHNNYCLG